MSTNHLNNVKTPFVDSPEDGAQRRLEQLGYPQELNRGLSVFGNVVMALSNVSPLLSMPWRPLPQWVRSQRQPLFYRGSMSY